jgi:hypothetical protein
MTENEELLGRVVTLLADSAKASLESAKTFAKSAEESNAVLQNDISYIKKDVSEIKEKMESHYVTKDEFEPVKKVVYGLVALILVAVVGAAIALVIVR